MSHCLDEGLRDSAQVFLILDLSVSLGDSQVVLPPCNLSNGWFTKRTENYFEKSTAHHHRREYRQNQITPGNLLVFDAHAHHPTGTVGSGLSRRPTQLHETHSNRIVIQEPWPVIERPVIRVEMN